MMKQLFFTRRPLLWFLLPMLFLMSGCTDLTLAESYVGYYNVTADLNAVLRDANGVDHAVWASQSGEMYLGQEGDEGEVYTEGLINTTGYVDKEGYLHLDPSSCYVELESATLPDMEANLVLIHSVARHQGSFSRIDWTASVESSLRNYDIVSATVSFRATYVISDNDDYYYDDYYTD